MTASASSARRRKAGWWLLWKVAETAMMVVGILVTAAVVVGIGWVVVTWWNAAASLPVQDGLGHDGRSARTALVIEAATETESLVAEYDWFYLHRPLDSIKGERLVGRDGRIFHVLEIITWTGESRDLWFDITVPFGNE